MSKECDDLMNEKNERTDLSKDICSICLNTRSLFRRSVWLQVAMSRDDSVGEEPSCSRLVDFVDDDVVTNVKDPTEILRNANRNLSQANQKVETPFCIFMIEIDMKEISLSGCSSTQIESIVKQGTMHGLLSASSRIIVQILFTDEETVAIVATDMNGVEYCFNLPDEPHEAIALRCVCSILKGITENKPFLMMKIVPYQKRSLYEDCLYAMFITGVFVTAISRSAGLANDETANLKLCTSSFSAARPTRVNTNLRFLLALCDSQSKPIVETLLLDEINTLDCFRDTFLAEI
jgi:hypothetical protein